MTLPFVPYPGVKLPLSRESDLMPQLEEVFWDMSEGAFIAVCADQDVSGDEQEAISLLDEVGWASDAG